MGLRVGSAEGLRAGNAELEGLRVGTLVGLIDGMVVAMDIRLPANLDRLESNTSFGNAASGQDYPVPRGPGK